MKTEESSGTRASPAIRLVHHSLSVLGYHIARGERRKLEWGESTRAALAEFSQAHGLPPTVGGAVDANILRALREHAARREGLLRIEGRVADRTTGAGEEDLLVEVWDNDLLFDDFVGADLTGPDGRFSVLLDPGSFNDCGLDSTPELFFKVFRDGALLLSTERRTLWNADSPDTFVTLEAELGSPPGAAGSDGEETAGAFEVRGRVFSGETPLAGARVRAVDRDFRRESVLGDARTDSRGAFLIRYSRARLARPDKERADLVVRVLGDGGEEVLAESPVLPDAAPRTEVDLIVPPSGSASTEYARVSGAVGTLLAAHRVEPDALTDEEAVFLAKELGMDVAPVAAYALAHRQHTRFHEVSPAAFYALARQQLPPEVEWQSPRVLADALHGALNRAVVSAAELGAEVDEIVKRLTAPRRAALDLRVKAALASSPVRLGTRIRERFGRLVGELDGDTLPAAFWRDVENDAVLGRAADELKLTFRLDALAHGNAPLLAGLQRAARREDGTPAPHRLADLGPGDWQRLVAGSVEAGAALPPGLPGDTPAVQAQHYASLLERAVEHAFPTPFVAREMARPPRVDAARAARVLRANPGLRLDAPALPETLDLSVVAAAERDAARADLHTLHAEALRFPAVDIAASVLGVGTAGTVDFLHPVREAVSGFLQTESGFDLRTTTVDGYLAGRATLLDRLDGGVRVEAVEQLRALQRVYQVARTGTQMDALLSAGLHSALDVSSLDEQSFVALYGEILGGAAEARAAHRRASAITAVTTLTYADVQQATSDVLPYAIGGGASATTAGERVASWSSLFGRLELCDCPHCRSVYGPAAYLVDLLQFLRPREQARQPYEVLAARRPDIVDLPLTCENTNTALPYVDLVCEALESYVVHGSPRSGTTSPQATPEALAVHREYGPAFGQETSDDAYGRLARAVFPHSLPFHRPLEAVRTYLHHLGTSRLEVLETFAADPDAAGARLDRAAEALRLSPRESAIVRGSALTPAEPLRAFYGYDRDTVRSDEVWLDDDLPPGAAASATGGDTWEWVTLAPRPFSGSRAHRSALVPGAVHQHVFELPAGSGVDVVAGDRLFACVYLDPEHPPETVMLQWNDGSWEHRAFWGADRIAWGARGSAGHRRVGDLPEPGRWVRLEVSAAEVGLEGRRVIGMAFTLWGGRATWDRAGRETDANWRSDLARVPAFQDRTGLAFPRLLELLSARVLAGVALGPSAGGDPCDIGTRRLTGLNDARLGRLHRFLRLARALGAPLDPAADAASEVGAEGLREADRAFHLWGGLPAGEFLTRVGEARRLHAELMAGDGPAGLSFGLLLSLWGSLDTHRYLAIPDGADPRELPSLYEQLFRNPATASPLDPDFEPAATAAGLRGEASTLTAKAPLLRAVLRLSEEDLLAFRADAGLGDADATLSLASLSALHRRALAARLLGLSAGDFLRLKALSGIDPFSEPRETRRLRELVEEVRASGVPMADLAFLFLPRTPAARAAGAEPEPLSDTAVAALAEELRVALAALAAQPRATPVTPAEAALEWRALVFRVAAEHLQAERELVELLAGTVLPAAGGGTLRAADDLLRAGDADFPPAAPDPSRPGAAVFDPRATTPPAVPAFVRAARLLDKAVRLAGGLGVGARELAGFLTARSGGGPSLDLARLPLELPDPTAAPAAAAHDAQVRALFAGWRELAAVAAARHAFPGAAAAARTAAGTAAGAAVATLADTLAAARAAGATRAGVLDLLTQALAGGGEGSAGAALGADLAAFFGARGVNATVDQLASAVSLRRFARALAIVRRTGADLPTLFAWARTEPDAAQARAVETAARSRHDEEAWLRVAPPLSNRLRDRQRPALVAYVLQLPGIRARGLTEANQLFEFFLIDVEMTSAMRTSRVKQAISSVQLFVQRCLLNLEPEVPPARINATQWRWMKSYRVWEANRKVFLYPENWIEPELRDDRSPAFRELESDLLQRELTAETAESAFLEYLQKLDAVAHLEPCGICHEPPVEREDGTQGKEVLHLFGRTPGSQPHRYFHRGRVNGVWTPWERLDLDIQGDHLLPVAHNRRLYLFWPVVEKVSLESDNPLPAQNSAVRPRERMEIRLAWSERRNGRWAAGSTSRERLRTTPDSALARELEAKRAALWFRASHDAGGDLRFEVLSSADASNGGWVGGTRVGWFRFSDCRSELSSTPEVGSTFVSFNSAAGTSVWNNATRAVVEFQIRPYVPPIPIVPLPLTLPRQGGDDPIMVTVLRGMPELYRVLAPHHATKLTWSELHPFAYVDTAGTFVAVPRDETVHMPLVIPLMIPSSMGHLFTERDRLDGTYVVSLAHLLTDRAPVLQLILPTVADPEVLVRGNAAVSERVAPIEQALARMSTGRRWTGEEPGAAGYTPMDGKTTLIHAHSRSGIMEARIASADPADEGAGMVAADEGLQSWTTFIQGVMVRKLEFSTHFHPHVCAFVRALQRDGVWGLLTLENQRLTGDVDDAGAPGNRFRRRYDPDQRYVHEELPTLDVDFRHGGAYALYNWELFFHAPLLVAERLVRERRFEEAQRWFHVIFDPARGGEEPTPQRFWRFLPFHLNREETRIERLLRTLADPNSPDVETKRDLERQIEEWRDNPFEPHRIARLRLGAYQKTVVMKYLSMLLAWGDECFARDTIESINEATQLYVLAWSLLGPRPERIPELAVPRPISYRELAAGDRLDRFSNRLVEMESRFPFVQLGGLGSAPGVGAGTLTAGLQAGLGIGRALYFGIPRNDKLLACWGTVEDRLFKIRHGLDLEGRERPLALFEPPLDPGALVRAAAGGGDFRAAVPGTFTTQPLHRFTFLLPRAVDLCGEVRGLGGALLAALEKKDAETLARLRARHESGMLGMVRQVREAQVEEAKAALAGLRRTRAVTEFRLKHYEGLAFISPFEGAHLALQAVSSVFQHVGGAADLGASVARLIPDFDVGASGWAASPVAKARFGGSNVAGAMEAFSKYMSLYASLFGTMAQMASTLGTYHRRAEDWSLQRGIAERELRQIDEQITAGGIRLQIAERELANHDRQIENAREVEAFYRDKFTSEQLYEWTVTQVAGLYFQAYRLAFDAARRAEAAYRLEHGLTDSAFVSFGHWDGLRRGLLAGERLQLDLKRLEAAHLEQSQREYEITRHVSLVLLDPAALVTLKATGRCGFTLPEALFDQDYPGHYLRRIRTVALTLPCVTGPYGGVHATLSLETSCIRRSPLATGYAAVADPANPVPANTGAASDRFLVDFMGRGSIATSTGQGDTGLFELQLRDERYLPFEGAGAVSRWTLEVPRDANAWDLDTLSDVVFTLRYTARDGGEALRAAARAAAQLPAPAGFTASPAGAGAAAPVAQPALRRLFSLRHEFPDAWRVFLRPAAPGDGHILLLPLTAERFPFPYRGRRISVSAWELVLQLAEGVRLGTASGLAYPGPAPAGSLLVRVTAPGGAPAPTTQALDYNAALLGGTPYARVNVSGAVGADPSVTWRMELPREGLSALNPALVIDEADEAGTTHRRLRPELVQDLLLICHYSVT